LEDEVGVALEAEVEVIAEVVVASEVVEEAEVDLVTVAEAGEDLVIAVEDVGEVVVLQGEVVVEEEEEPRWQWSPTDMKECSLAVEDGRMCC